MDNFYSPENPKLAYLCDTKPACDKSMPVPCSSVTGRFHIITIIIIVIIIIIIISMVFDLFLLPLRNYYFKGDVSLVNSVRSPQCIRISQPFCHSWCSQLYYWGEPSALPPPKGTEVPTESDQLVSRAGAVGWIGTAVPLQGCENRIAQPVA